MAKEGFVKRIGNLLNAFSGDGVGGKKSLDELKAEHEELSAEAKTDDEKKALAELEDAIKKAEEEAATDPSALRQAQDERPAETLKEKKERLKKLKAENERLTKEEDAKGFMDGVLAGKRMARKRDIKGLEAEVKDV